MSSQLNVSWISPVPSSFTSRHVWREAVSDAHGWEREMIRTSLTLTTCLLFLMVLKYGENF